MNYLSKIFISSFPFLYSATLLGAYIMDGGRMNNQAGYQDQNDYYNNGQLAYNGRIYHEMDSTPVPQEQRFYRTPGSPMYSDPQEQSFYRFRDGRIYSPDPNRPPQFDQGPYPYPPTDYDNKNRRWAYDEKSDLETPWVADNQGYNKQALQQHDPLSDGGISQKIRHTIKRDSMLEDIAKNIEVEVKNGTVTLEGKVHTKAEKNKIDYITNSVDGVKSVSNKIKIEH